MMQLNLSPWRAHQIIIGALIFLFSMKAIGLTLTLPKTLRQRCVKEQDFASCYELAYMYQNTSVPGDIELGNQFAQYACKLELKRKCSLQEATAHTSAHWKAKIEWDSEKQEVLRKLIKTVRTPAEIKCLEGHAESCSRAGTHYFYTAPIRNPGKGKALFEEGCRLGDKSSCSSLDLIKRGVVKVFDVEI